MAQKVVRLTSLARCAGWASKLSPEDLAQVLSKIPIVQDPNLLVGIETGDDAAVYRIGENLALVLTTDYFPPIVDDPYQYGAIAAANALSDVYAMGGRPILALNLVNFPADLSKDILGDILRGGFDKAKEAGVLIVGGHTIDDVEPKYGMAVTGLVEPGKQVTNAGARPGDMLLLTKPIGTGIITTAGKQGVVEESVLSEAIQLMSTLNKAASEAMVAVGVNACTDITGFGLIGHLLGVVKASRVGARLYLSKIPVIPGTRELVMRGIAPGGTHRNRDSVGNQVHWHPSISEEDKLILCDAQTSGGLLISVPSEKLSKLETELRARGVAYSGIGEVLAGGAHRITVQP